MILFEMKTGMFMNSLIDYSKLNNSLSRAEEIIGSNYGFVFYNPEEQENVCQTLFLSIVQSRIIAEGICLYIVTEANLAFRDLPTLQNYIKCLSSNLIASDVITHANSAKTACRFR